MKNFLISILGTVSLAMSVLFSLAAILVFYSGPACVACLFGATASFVISGVAIGYKE